MNQQVDEYMCRRYAIPMPKHVPDIPVLGTYS